MSTKIDETNILDVTRYQGDSWVFEVEITDDSETPIDVSGATVNLKVGTITEATSGVHITNGGATGIIGINIPFAVMETLEVDSYDIAFEYILDGVKKTVFTGTLTLVEDVR